MNDKKQFDFLLPHRVEDFPTQKNFEVVEEKIREIKKEQTTTGQNIETLQNQLNSHLGDYENPHKVSFLKLEDTPSEFTDNKGCGLVVNNTEDGLDFSIYNGIETQNRIIYVDPVTGSDTTGDGSASAPFKTIQCALSTVKKIIPEDVTITIQLGPNDGSSTRTFPINSVIKIKGFMGGGTLQIRGDTSDYTASSSKLITLDGSGLNDNIFLIQLNNVNVIIKALKIIVDTSLGWWSGINIKSNPATFISYCAIEGKDATQGHCIYATYGSFVDITRCYLSNTKNGIMAEYNSGIVSRYNYSYGTLPSNGLAAWKQSRIAKVGDQPAGSANNEVYGSGGEIE